LVRIGKEKCSTECLVEGSKRHPDGDLLWREDALDSRNGLMRPLLEDLK
jgi:hypothetical protein